MDIGRVGIWTVALQLQPLAKAHEAAAELEELGYGAVWIPEVPGLEALVGSALLLSGTRKIVVATGIANIWLRTPLAAAGAHRALTAAFPDRFLLGLGISHGPLIEGLLKQTYDRPVARMREYLDGMDALPSAGGPTPMRALAALGPRMLKLARDRTHGAHPYFVPVEHTPVAREALGAGRLLCPEQAVVLETDAAKARAVARTHMATYLTLPNYTNNLRRLGWTEEDLSNGGSDKLVDAIVAWGTVADIAARVKAHHDAGADHVCIQVLDPNFAATPMPQWRELAPALLGR